MNTCKTCRWFSQTALELADISDESFGKCGNRIFQDSMTDFPTYTRVLYYDHESGGYYCSLYVHETFGCVGWEEKDGKNKQG